MSPLRYFRSKEKGVKESSDIQIRFDDDLGIFRVTRADEKPTRYVASPAIIARKQRRALMQNAANKEKKKAETPVGQ